MAEMKCECGGTFEESTEIVEGMEIACMKCNKCKKILYTSEQMKELLEAKTLSKKTTTKRKVIILGHSFAITLPKSLERIGLKAGQRISMRMVGNRTLEIKLPPKEDKTDKDTEKNKSKTSEQKI